MHLAGRACAELRLFERAMDFLVACKEILDVLGCNQLQLTLDVTFDLAAVFTSLNEFFLASRFWEEAIQICHLLGALDKIPALEQLLLNVCKSPTNNLGYDKFSTKNRADSTVQSDDSINVTGKEVYKLTDKGIYKLADNDSFKPDDNDTHKLTTETDLIKLINSLIQAENFDEAINCLIKSQNLFDCTLVTNDITQTLAKLHHIKVNIAKTTKEEKNSIAEAERYYRKAEDDSTVYSLKNTIFYAALCYQQQRYEDALLLLMQRTKIPADQICARNTFGVDRYELSILPVS